MKRFLFLLLFLPATLAYSDESDSSTAVLSMWIRASDLIAGEAGFGAGSLFGLMIENHSSNPVRLASESDINAQGPWWKLSAEGPMDSRCLEISKSAVKPVFQRSPGWVPFLEIPPHSAKRVAIGPYDLSTPGFYTLNAEYDGTTSPEGCFKGMLKANTKTFIVKEPTGVDLEIIQKWSQQNPGKPYCYFPRNMKPNILNEDVLLSEFPDSSYAARVVLGYFDGSLSMKKEDPYVILKNASLVGDTKSRIEKEAVVLKHIIDDRPDFPRLTYAKMMYCLRLWSIDRRAECIENLRVWSKDKDFDLSSWAKKCLDATDRLQREGKK
jgi:hypothetical protein